MRNKYNTSSFCIQNFKTLDCLCSWAGRFESYLVANPEDRFSRDEAQLKTAQKSTLYWYDFRVVGVGDGVHVSLIPQNRVTLGYIPILKNIL